MSTAVKMPQLGESTVEGTIARWLKAPGDSIAKFEPLLEISTDKIDTEVPAPTDGTLLEIVVPEGKTVAVNTILAYIGQAGEAPTVTTPATPVNAHSSPAPVAVAPSQVADPAAKPTGRAFVSPVVARIAEEHQIDLAGLEGSGLGGRITKKDILAVVNAPVPPPPIAALPPVPPSASPSQPPTGDETVQPLSAMRRAIAQHMVLSKQTSPHVTTVFEVDMTAVVQHREAHKAHFATRGINLTFTPYFVVAVAHALREVPEANSRWTADGLLINRRIHIGLAVSLPDGLIVPVLRDADEKTLPGLARAVNEAAERARAGKLTSDAIQGGTFTITNHGTSGSLMGTPIINQPQAGILGIGAITKRAMVRTSSASLLPSADDAIVIRPMCYLSFSFDHRVLDGAKADLFLSKIRVQLENWQHI